ncbi:dihydrolipoamide dehydrogenase [Pragia fontium]|uniref:NAD(P)/FAD-dependent oxidoreductase n=1 Tax=Pragia fontium TaxID=82985 RepID=UPI000E086C67|nr:FAD/NAD(P)-binding oxidoreductase [Pragia fontium]SUB83556.1 dihydrolipoamide dehydrogenase [Pragia fontium]
MKLNYDVVIIGSGPSGIAAATALKQQGVHDIVILEREAQAGGVPRHCQHPTFGLLTFKRPMKGSHFVEHILKIRGDVPVLTGMTVVGIYPDGKIQVSCDAGLVNIQAKRIIIATGVRETPRHPRLVSGLRPQGVLTTGALQQFIYLNRQTPCRNPVIIGTEIVSFSALWTLRNAGVKAKAMIEQGARITANRPLIMAAKLFGVAVYCQTKLVEIGGLNRVEYVMVERNGQREKIECDSVIFTGEFTGEYTLIKGSHLDYRADTGCPVVDNQGRCSDAAYYAIGNLLHPADMGDQCYQEGMKVGLAVAKDLQCPAPKASLRLPIVFDEKIQFTAPSCIAADENLSTLDLNIRVKQAITGTVVVKSGNQVLYQKKHRCLPGRRIMLKGVNSRLISGNATEINVSIV